MVVKSRLLDEGGEIDGLEAPAHAARDGGARHRQGAEAPRTNPRAAVEKEIGQRLPAGVRIQVHGETADVLHLVVAERPSEVAGLSDEELERVAAGAELARWRDAGVAW